MISRPTPKEALSGHTDQLGDGIRTKENTLLHSGGIELHRQVGKNRDDNREVHHVHEDSDEGNHDDLLLLRRERHNHVTSLGITCVYEKDNGRMDRRISLWSARVFPRVVSTIMIGVERYQKSERYLFETQLYLFLCGIEALLRGLNGLSMAQQGG